jgi:hypothetical protein
VSVSRKENDGTRLHITFKTKGKKVTSKAASLVQISATSLLLIATRPCIKNTFILKPNFINQQYLMLSSNVKLLGDKREL